MLLGGSFGSLIPSLLSTGSMTVRNRILTVAISEIVSVISLAIAIYSWELIPTVIMLTLYFTAWQVVNVITYSQLALSLKNHQHKLHDDIKSKSSVNNDIDSPMTDGIISHSNHLLLSSPRSDLVMSSDEAPEPPFSISIIAIAAACVIIQIIIQSVIFSGLQYDLYPAMVVIAIIFFVSTFFHVCSSSYLWYAS
jgi:hypothetical protein